jgi:hypothetical protein
MQTAAGAQRANVLRAYRELLSLLRGLPSARREGALSEARAGVRANAGEVDPGAASEQLKALWARISFLRTVRGCVAALSPGRQRADSLRKCVPRLPCFACRNFSRVRLPQQLGGVCAVRRRCRAGQATARAAAARS